MILISDYTNLMISNNIDLLYEISIKVTRWEWRCTILSIIFLIITLIPSPFSYIVNYQRLSNMDRGEGMRDIISFSPTLYGFLCPMM